MLAWKHMAAGGLCSTARNHTLLNFLLLEVLSQCTKLSRRAWKCLLCSCPVGCWSNITTWICASCRKKNKLPVIFIKRFQWIHFTSEIETLFFLNLLKLHWVQHSKSSNGGDDGENVHVGEYAEESGVWKAESYWINISFRVRLTWGD